MELILILRILYIGIKISAYIAQYFACDTRCYSRVFSVVNHREMNSKLRRVYKSEERVEKTGQRWRDLVKNQNLLQRYVKIVVYISSDAQS